MNFKKLDKMIRFNYKGDLDVMCKAYDKDTVSSCIHHLYYEKNKSSREVAECLGVSNFAILNWMGQWGMERRSPGGNRQNEKLNDPAVVAKIMSSKGVVSSRVAAAGICRASTVRAMWGRGD